MCKILKKFKFVLGYSFGEMKMYEFIEFLYRWCFGLYSINIFKCKMFEGYIIFKI